VHRSAWVIAPIARTHVAWTTLWDCIGEQKTRIPHKILLRNSFGNRAPTVTSCSGRRQAWSFPLGSITCGAAGPCGLPAGQPAVLARHNLSRESRGLLPTSRSLQWDRRRTIS